MIQSMTGYGKSAAEYNGRKIVVEIKSLNSKGLDITTHVPTAYFYKDLTLRQAIKEKLIRGKVDLSITTEDNAADTTATISMAVAKEYANQISRISKEAGIGEPKDIWSVLIRMPGLWQTQNAQEVSDEEWAVVCQTLDEAITNLIAFRSQEGEAVARKFTEKLQNIGRYLNDVAQFETLRTDKIRQQITERLQTLPVDYDRNRLEQEMIYYIEKLDINEEKQRLGNHLKYFADTMQADGAQGKKLGFIAQEMGREINTMGSKSNLAEMQNLVVKMKDELEQIKEQVLNVL